MSGSYDFWWIWCLFLVIGFGGCAGSFINVVIHRLPRNIPLGRPRWSFCPHCHVRIHWRDNIPIISYFLLGGRCRACGNSIAVRYVIIEIITVLVFVVLFDAFFVSGVLHGILTEPWAPVAYRFYSDWPIYLAHVLLFSSLIAMSVIDMEHYWVDIRFTHLAALGGFVCHAAWTPLRTPSWPRPGPTLAGAALLGAAVAVVSHLVIAWRMKRRHEAEQQLMAEDTAEPPAAPGAASQVPEAHGGVADPVAPRRPGGAAPATAWLSAAVLAMCLTMLIVELVASCSTEQGGTVGAMTLDREPRVPMVGFALRAAPLLVYAFVVVLAGSVVRRDSDQQIAETLEAERHSARRTALVEFALLLPAMAALAAGGWLLAPGGPLHGVWEHAWQWRLGRDTRPVVGLGTAAGGFVIAGGVGWAVRISFTLCLGKEAFGSGDIHIMAAAGAVMGWEVVVVGFLLACVLALLGWALTLPFKSGRALPMCSWITLGLFVTLLLRERAFALWIEPIRSIVHLWLR